MPATVHLTPRAPHRALAGHPWIYRNEIGRVDGATAPGDLVEVRDARGDLVGTGYHNEKSMIAVRLLARGARAIDAAFWRDRLRAAIAYRAEVVPGAEACRLV